MIRKVSLFQAVLLCTALLVGQVPSAMAKIETHQFETPQQEALYKEMIAELRCLVCQNQNLADSNAELAQDLRAKTYEMVTANKSRNEIVDFMVQRYGDFVLYKPPFKPATLALWLGPVLIFLFAIWFAMRQIKHRGREAASAQTSNAADKSRSEAKKLLADED